MPPNAQVEVLVEEGDAAVDAQVSCRACCNGAAGSLVMYKAYT